MYPTHSRRMHYLSGLQIILVTLLFCSTSCLQAQSSRGNYNYLDFQQKPYYFGITLATNTANYKIFRSREFLLNDSIASVSSLGGPGFNLGIVSNLKIGENFDFRFLPTLSFSERNIEYKGTGENPRPIPTRRIESVFVEFPFHVRYKSAPYNDMRVFVIGGVKYSFDVASESRARNTDELVKIAPNDFSIEYGAGIQFFFPYFIFSPEIKISQGLGNILIFDNNLNESRVIEKILSRSFTISLHFEG